MHLGHVVPDPLLGELAAADTPDVQRMAPHVLTHRFILTSKAKYSGAQQADVIADTLSAVAVPT